MIEIKDLAGLSAPIEKFIEKVSGAVGSVYEPTHVRRMAKAQADASIIAANADVKVSAIQQRAINRMIFEETKRQENIESITEIAIKSLDHQAKPDEIDNDWLSNFFEKSKIISDEQMQTLWAKILAGEANRAGSFSLKTIEIVTTLSKTDANIFSNLTKFVWDIGGPTLLVFDRENSIYQKNGITFESLQHLESIGLVSLSEFVGFQKELSKDPQQKQMIMFTTYASGKMVPLFTTYANRAITLCRSVENQEKASLDVGQAALTRAGRELYSICATNGDADFQSYVISYWAERGWKALIQAGT